MVTFAVDIDEEEIATDIDASALPVRLWMSDLFEGKLHTFWSEIVININKTAGEFLNQLQMTYLNIQIRCQYN
jgi:hypothetical protein